MMQNKKKGKIGSSFEDYLKEQGTLKDIKRSAIERVKKYLKKKTK